MIADQQRELSLGFGGLIFLCPILAIASPNPSRGLDRVSGRQAERICAGGSRGPGTNGQDGQPGAPSGRRLQHPREPNRGSPTAGEASGSGSFAEQLGISTDAHQWLVNGEFPSRRAWSRLRTLLRASPFFQTGLGVSQPSSTTQPPMPYAAPIADRTANSRVRTDGLAAEAKAGCGRQLSQPLCPRFRTKKGLTIQRLR